jgi:eukaryotic-like serine/threonine-protein kinase
VATTAPAQVQDLIDLIRRSGVLTPAAISALPPLPDDPMQAATILVQQGVLTKFQARMLLAGKSRGFRLGNYIIRDQIGTGGMGSVYLAEHQDIKRRVAVKVLNLAAAENQLSLERFLREAKTAASLDHPNIVKLFDVARDGDTRYLVMEYIEGQTLEEMIRKGPVPTSKAVDYIIQAALGLQHAYEKGIVHRDIKPANLIVGKDETLRILDMGLARPVEQSAGSLTEHLDRGAVVGTADYVAPEQALNEPNVDVRADIYSLGVTFFALVAGRPPFDGSTANKLLSHQLKTAPSLTSLDKTFPPKLSQIIIKMMEKKPGNRYQTPADLIQALEPWLSDAPPPASTKTNLSAPSRGHTKPLANRALSKANLKPMQQKSAKAWLLPVIIGSVLAAIVATVLAIFLFGNKAIPTKPTDISPPTGNSSQPDNATPTTSASTNPLPPPPPPEETVDRVLYSLDLTEQKPFRVTMGLDAVKGKTGEGELPLKWAVKVWKATDEVVGFGEANTIGTKTVKGNGILFSPDISLDGAERVRVTFEYQSKSDEKRVTMRFRELQDKPVADTTNANIAPAGTWTTIEKVIPTAKMKTARIEFHNSDDTPSSDFRIRKFTVSAVEPKK